jgi:hypothetical protein
MVAWDEIRTMAASGDACSAGQWRMLGWMRGAAVHDWLWLRRPEEEYNVGKIENKEDDRRAPLIATINGVKVPSIPSFSTLPTKQKN